MWREMLYQTLMHSKGHQDFCDKLGVRQEFDQPVVLGEKVLKSTEDACQLLFDWRWKWQEARAKVRIGDLEALCNPLSLKRFTLSEKEGVRCYTEVDLSASTSLVYQFLIDEVDRLFVVVHKDADSADVAYFVYWLYAQEKGYPTKYSYITDREMSSFSRNMEITFYRGEEDEE